MLRKHTPKSKNFVGCPPPLTRTGGGWENGILEYEKGEVVWYLSYKADGDGAPLLLKRPWSYFPSCIEKRFHVVLNVLSGADDGGECTTAAMAAHGGLRHMVSKGCQLKSSRNYHIGSQRRAWAGGALSGGCALGGASPFAHWSFIGTGTPGTRSPGLIGFWKEPKWRLTSSGST